MYDVLIIGGGVSGTMIARELSRYKLDIALVERAADLAMGSTKANSAIVHAGYDATPGTLKAKTNLEGNPMFDQLSKELNFPFKRIGSLVLAFREEDLPKLEALRERGEANGVPNLVVLNREELLELEPNLGDTVVAALHAPTAGIVCPYEMTFALGENAAENGVQIFLNQEVIGITKEETHFSVKTYDTIYKAKIVINAAGVYADEIHNCLSKTKLEIIPRAGEYIVFDRTAGKLVNHTLFQLPSDMGKGVLVTPSVDGNLLIGPTAQDREDKDDTSTTPEGRDGILSAAGLSLKEIPTRAIITGFTGLRAHSVTNDFIIGHVEDVENMIDVAGIESPGLTASPAIGKMVVKLVGELISLKENPNFNPIRKNIPRFRELSEKERTKLIEEDPAYGHIICRCETITEAEIMQAIHRPVGARTIDAVKFRVRAGMGRCQGGFCAPHVVEILARELGIKPTEVTKNGGNSMILTGENRPIKGYNHGE